MLSRRAITLAACAVGIFSVGCADRVIDHPGDAPAPPPIQTDAALSGIWGLSETDLWVVGSEGTILHGDGTSWTPEDSGVQVTLHDVHGSAPDDVWAVGDSAVLHYDGAGWQTVLVDSDLTFLGVWNTSPNDAWAVGASTMDGAGIIKHWDGEAWHEGEAGATFWDVWGRNDEVWVAGTLVGGGGLVFKGGDGQAFDQVGYDGESARGVWGNGTDVWVAPYEGTLHHFDGTTWEALPPAPHGQVLDVTGTSGGDIWAVGLHGAAFHFDGTAWNAADLGTDQTIMAVWAAAEDDAWLVGGAGTLRHWNGGAWTR